MSAATVLDGVDAVRAAVGRHLGTTAWTELTRAQVDRFAEAVGSTPHGSGDDAAAPPLLVLALTNLFMPRLVEVRGVSMGVNYGTGEVRFPAAAPVPGRLRAGAELVACEDIAGGVQTTIRITVEAEDAEGTADPVCVVDALSRWIV
jgi:acyl dehydratase